MAVSSKENSLIKLVSKLQKSASARRENGLFVLEGLRICDDAYQNGILFDKLIISKTADEKYSKNIEKFAEISKECYILPDSLFKKICDTTTPQGIIAIAKIPATNVKNILKTGRYIALENVADPANLGAVSRTAEALGVSGILLSSNSCDPYSPKALRASMGTLLRMPVILVEDFIGEIKKSGLKAYSCVVDRNAKSITDVEFSSGSAVIIGNEANGITEETKNASDEQITIRMSGKAESLNAAAAASIAMWEMMKC